MFGPGTPDTFQASDGLVHQENDPSELEQQSGGLLP